jgi:DNA-binding winged helix-turn-helix (wHTH) protein
VLRDDLTRAAWGRQASPLDRALDVHISRLRRKIAAGARIITVRGVGYMLAVCPTRSLDDSGGQTTDSGVIREPLRSGR